MIKMFLLKVASKIFKKVRTKVRANEVAVAGNKVYDRTPFDVAVVPVKPASKSKINWAQFVGPASAVIAGLLGYYGFEATPEEIGGMLGGIWLLQSIVTWVFRTWGTASITPQSLPKVK